VTSELCANSGRAAWGRVYLADQISLHRKVAIKVLREDIAANPTALERFKAESKIVAQLSHPNVVQVHMVGKHEGRRFMVLEYVEGKSLRDYLLRKGSLDVMIVLSSCARSQPLCNVPASWASSTATLNPRTFC